MGERKFIGLKIVQQTEEKVKLIKDRLKAASDCQKSYIDLKRRDIEYAVGDKVFFKGFPLEKNYEIWQKGEAKSSLYRTV